MSRDALAAQVELLVRTLPVVASEDAFALKGGTAINLFYRDLPRLSVDIDLVYLPVDNRERSLAAIDAALARIVASAPGRIRGATAQRVTGGDAAQTRVLVRLGEVEIKIETSPVLRGTVHEPELRAVTDPVQDRFGFSEIRVVSFEDLFGGKLHAALDRQHPRDLFDVRLLYEHEGITDALFRTFLIYVASSSRPAHELLAPSFIDLDQPYAREFEGMTSMPTTLAQLLETRSRLIADIRARLNRDAAKFLLSIHDATPDFEMIGLPRAAALPAVRWKLINMERLIREDPDKHARQREQLEMVLSTS